MLAKADMPKKRSGMKIPKVIIRAVRRPGVRS